MSLNETNETNDINNTTTDVLNTKDDVSLLSVSNSTELMLETQNGEIEFESLYIDNVMLPRKFDDSFSSDK